MLEDPDTLVGVVRASGLADASGAGGRRAEGETSAFSVTNSKDTIESLSKGSRIIIQSCTVLSVAIVFS